VLIVERIVLGNYFEAIRRSVPVGHAADVRPLNENVAGIPAHKGANGRAARFAELVFGLIKRLI
jgi:hypothetical protein